MELLHEVNQEVTPFDPIKKLVDYEYELTQGEVSYILRESAKIRDEYKNKSIIDKENKTIYGFPVEIVEVPKKYIPQCHNDDIDYIKAVKIGFIYIPENYNFNYHHKETQGYTINEILDILFRDEEISSKLSVSQIAFGFVGFDNYCCKYIFSFLYKNMPDGVFVA